ncbi:hypothetical protein K7H92_07380 [Pseudomonas stutzeri]|nr:hypothetical protein [Stutzerimonas stutzeri]
MQALPSYDYFTRAAGSLFRLQLNPEHGVDIELQQVEQRVPMNARYECFSLLFRLPEGLDLPQALYRLHGPDGSNWELLLTPVRPDAGGRCLEAVFHREKSLA